MRTALWILVIIAGLCMSPFVLGVVFATFASMVHGIYSFVKEPSWDGLSEFLCGLAALCLMAGMVLGFCIAREENRPKVTVQLEAEP